jgi:hypothetical protein
MRLLQCYNGEPDGRLHVLADGEPLLQICTEGINNFSEALRVHSGSEGDGLAFELDLQTGEVRKLWRPATSASKERDPC